MQGVVAAVPTPIDDAGDPQKELFLEHCTWSLANGCDGLNVLGSTGEANSHSIGARKDVMGWAADGLDKDRLMVGTGTPALSETIGLTRFAAELGYKIALVLPPYYYKPVSHAGLVEWYTRLHEALDDQKIQIYFYNFPQMTGLKIPVETIAELSERYPARFTGIKDSSGDLEYCRALVAANAGFRVFPSSETTLSEAHVAGFAGCISATTNMTAPFCGEVWKNRDAPPANVVARIGVMREAIVSAGLVPAVKYLVGERTANKQWRSITPPFLPLSEDAGRALTTKLTI